MYAGAIWNENEIEGTWKEFREYNESLNLRPVEASRQPPLNFRYLTTVKS